MSISKYDMMNARGSNSIDLIAKELAASTEVAIVEQINELVKSGVLSFETAEPQIYSKPGSGELEIIRPVRITFKGQEKIEQITQENKHLKEIIAAIKGSIASVENGV